MINASGGSLPTQSTNSNSDSTTPVVPTPGPGFPTHNPAVQHKQFMTPATPIGGSPATVNSAPRNPATTAPVPNPMGAVPPAPPKFPDPTKNLVRVTDEGTDTVPGGSDGKGDTTKPKSKLNLKLIIGVAVLLLVILGSGVGFYLSQQQQEIRQQAYIGNTCNVDFDCNGPGNTLRSNINVPEYCNNGVCSTTPPAGATCPNPPHLPRVWCATFNCPNGDTTGDGECNVDDQGASYTIGGTECSNPSSGCGQVDYYSGGTPGQSWDQYCGHTFLELDCGGGGTPTPTPTATPTPTPTPGTLSCNSVCTVGGQACPSGTQCMITYNFSPAFENVTSTVSNVGTGTITGFKSFVRNGIVEQYLIRGGQIWYRPNFTTAWSNVTSNVSNVGTGTITSFSAFVNTSGAVEQYLIRGGQIWYRPNLTATTWQNVTGNVTNIGSGTIDSYNADKYAPGHGNIVSAYLIRGGKIWHHTSSNWNLWQDVTSNVSNVGTGAMTDISFHVNPDGSLRHHFVRGGQIWSRIAPQAAENRCRLATYPNSGSCQPPAPTPTNTPTPTPTATPTPTPTATPTPTPTPTPVPLTCNATCNPSDLVDQCTLANASWSCDATTSKCRRTDNPTSATCELPPLTCNATCNPESRLDRCTAANDKWFCDPATSTCRFEENPTSTTCQPPTGAVACNGSCTSDAQCQLTSDRYSCDTTTNTCRLTSNPTSTTCEPVPPKCNETCTSNAQCIQGNANHICDETTGTCRLNSNPGDANCQPPAATPTPTPTVGCNDACVTNADCSDTNHICTTTEDGSMKCRLASYPTSTSCTLPASATAQPTLPPELPATGPADWLNWLKAGLVTLGLGAALFFLL